MLELAKKVLAMTGSTSPVEYHPLPVDDPVRRRPDITLARELLGWEPTVPFDAGITRTVEYFRQQLAASAG
jgi:nucleoside-diphosphate-sugar epimerase